MQIVIDIPEEKYNKLVMEEEHIRACGSYYPVMILDGIPLPEHHGRLIDSTIVEKNIRTARLLEEVTDEMIVGLSVALDFCLDAPTVLEGVKE